MRGGMWRNVSHIALNLFETRFHSVFNVRIFIVLRLEECGKWIPTKREDFDIMIMAISVLFGTWILYSTVSVACCW